MHGEAVGVGAHTHYHKVMSTTDLYEHDFVAWTERQARELRALSANRWNGPLDLEHLAEEIEDLGRSQRHACESLLEQIIIHLLKLHHAKAEARDKSTHEAQYGDAR